MRFLGVVWGMVCVLAVGCGEEKLPVVTWEGDVTLSGKPIPKGATAVITVYTALGEGISQGTQGEIVNGHYLLKDVPVGDVWVDFNIVRRTPSQNTQDAGRGIMNCESLLPENFQPLREKAEKSEREKHFNLSTEKSKKLSSTRKSQKKREKYKKSTYFCAKR
ncbi:MAG: hypothetical protein Q4D98_08450 [Planctomycetia bacterium]|nr:hypothetical protein [Planctomycetia bacterium]